MKMRKRIIIGLHDVQILCEEPHWWDSVPLLWNHCKCTVEWKCLQCVFILYLCVKVTPDCLSKLLWYLLSSKWLRVHVSFLCRRSCCSIIQYLFCGHTPGTVTGMNFLSSCFRAESLKPSINWSLRIVFSSGMPFLDYFTAICLSWSLKDAVLRETNTSPHT